MPVCFLLLCHFSILFLGIDSKDWALYIPEGIEKANFIASSLKWSLFGEILPDSSIFHFSEPETQRRKRRIKRDLSTIQGVLWASEQKELIRRKREGSSSSSFSLSSSINEESLEEYRSHEKRKQISEETNMNSGKPLIWNDPTWSQMWYLNRGGDALDMNVQAVWKEGLSGKNVVVSILDDGLEWTHPDLIDNYDPRASLDLNDNDFDPSPRIEPSNTNKHGTRCAGQVAAIANNSYCSLGIAYKAKIGGVRILDGKVFDSLEARALSYNRNHIDIYSASWGPDDSGRSIDGPGPFAKRALSEGVTLGRGGKGSLFVWASGNGGKFSDNCNCDGYSTSIYTLSIGSTTENGFVPWYSESCSSTLSTTYSSGSSKKIMERKIYTTDLHGGCTDSHTGTSASSPMAAGILALALEANPYLTWRDAQYLVVLTSRGSANGYLQASDWRTNGIGLEFSHSYGFGLMDAHALVKLARNWTNVEPSLSCQVKRSSLNLKANRLSEVSVSLSLFSSSTNCPIRKIEHVLLDVIVESSSARGDLILTLTSPSGTTSMLLGPRPFDSMAPGYLSFSKWPLMSVHFWGESILGSWTLTLSNDGEGVTLLHEVNLIFHGVS